MRSQPSPAPAEAAQTQSPEPVPRPDVLAHVAGNVRRLRQAKGLSQAALAEASGLSRRMIVGIETGEANISLANLDRLAEALDVAFSEVVRAPDARDGARIDQVLWQGQAPESKAVLLGTAPARREAELWVWSLAPGEPYEARPDAVGWHEMIYVMDGTLILERNGETSMISPGDFLVFANTTPYTFRNAGPGPVRFIRNIAV